MEKFKKNFGVIKEKSLRHPQANGNVDFLLLEENYLIKPLNHVHLNFYESRENVSGIKFEHTNYGAAYILFIRVKRQ